MDQTNESQQIPLMRKKSVRRVKTAAENKKRVQLNISNYQELQDRNGYFVDKTNYIKKLEQYKNPVFIRNAYSGKSMWCSILSHYYDINRMRQFERSFSHTAIGKEPTRLRNKFMILHFDFSIVDVSGNLNEVENNFNNHCNHRLRFISKRYGYYFNGALDATLADTVSDNLNKLIDTVTKNKLPLIYIIIDNYDAFANQLMKTSGGSLYPKLVSGESFLTNFFSILKSGYQKGSIYTIFMTGELPVVIDDLYPEYDIASLIPANSDFNTMFGFSGSELSHLIDQIYHDYGIVPDERQDVIEGVKNHYANLTSVNPDKDDLYNPQLIMYFLRKLCTYKKTPAFLAVKDNNKIHAQ